MRVVFHDLDIIAGSDWELARGYLREELERIGVSINTAWDVAHNVDGTQKAGTVGGAFGEFRGTVAEQPTNLTTSDDGLLFFVSDFGHMVRWNGSLSRWEFAPGDLGNGFQRNYLITPQEVGWALCDGSLTSYLVVGGPTLGSNNITLPNLIGSSAYIKTAGSYTGSIIGATAPSISGITSADGDHDHGGSTGPSAAGIAIAHTTTPLIVDSGVMAPVSGHLAGNVIDDGVQTHPIASSGAHAHSVGSLAISATAEPTHINFLPYFRR